MEIYIIDFIAFIVYVFVSLFFLGFFSTPKKTDAGNDIRGNNSRKNSIESANTKVRQTAKQNGYKCREH